MRVVGYIRVSTDKQLERGFGLDVQDAAVRAWARANGHRLVDVYRDEGRSGTLDAPDRPGLASALAAVTAGRLAARPAGTVWADGIVVARLDRLARDLILQEQLLLEIRRSGQLHSAAAGEAHYLEDDPGDPSRALVRQILGAVSQYERSMIRLRLMAGRRRKAEQGGYAGGAPPLGYRPERRELVADETEQATLTRIRQLRRRGLSLRDIARTLEAEGHRPKRSERWHPSSLALIVDRKVNPSGAASRTPRRSPARSDR